MVLPPSGYEPPIQGDKLLLLLKRMQGMQVFVRRLQQVMQGKWW